MTALPAELLTVKQWTYSHNLRELKRPTHVLYRHNGAMTYAEAKEKAGKHKLVGFYATDKDPYVLGDIDNISDPMDQRALMQDLPLEFVDLLVNGSIYSEASPSGKGIRFIARLKDVETKRSLVGRYRQNKIKMKPPAKAQLNIDRPWQTITGNATPYSSNRISVIPIETIMTLFNFRQRDAGVVGTDYLPPPPIDEEEKLPTLREIEAALDNLPWDMNNRLLRSYRKTFGEEYSSYEYWLKIIMAVNDYAGRLHNQNNSNACMEAILRWSERDPEGWSGEEEVIKKWESLFRTEDKVSYHSLMALSYYNTLHWPQCKAPSAKQVEAGIKHMLPLVAQYSNFRAMVDFYNLKIYRDINSPVKLYITGDNDILVRYFTHIDRRMHLGKYSGPWSLKDIVIKFNIMCQEHGWMNIMPTQIKAHVSNWISEINRQIDMVREFFETSYDDLPDDVKEPFYPKANTPEYLFDCLTIEYLTDDHAREFALYKKYYKAWLMGIARNIFFPNSMHMNNCVLLLAGPEQIRKTSHFKLILPPFMRDDRIAFTPHGFATEASVRDITKLAATNNLVVWDEIEQFLNAETESSFKKLIDNNPIKVIDKYEVIESTIRPVAVYGGTSNQREFKLSDTGSRRMFIIPVTWVDTDAMMRTNWWSLITNLRDEIALSDKANPPWLLTEDELDFQASLHNKVTAKTSVELILREMFDFDQLWEFSSRHRLPNNFNVRSDSRVWTATDMNKLLQRKGYAKLCTRKHLVNVLHRMCGDWTGTTKRQKVLDTAGGKSKITVKRGAYNYNGISRFFLPPLITQNGGHFTNDDADFS